MTILFWTGTSRSVGFDVVERYRRLAALYREIGFDDEAAWIDRRLGHIEG